MLRGEEEKVLLVLSKGNTDGWETASTRIGNQPAGYKVRMMLCQLSGCRHISHV